MIAQGMDPKLASTLAGRACEVGVVKTARGAKKTAVKAKRKVGKTAKNMAKALEQANERARKKNGDFRKGFDQKKLMSLAHKIRKGMK